MLTLMAPGISNEERWRLIVNRDTTAKDFCFGVKSTMIFCRPGCPSRLPKRENVVIFDNARDAEAGGFRACLRCRPKEESVSAQVLKRACDYIQNHVEDAPSLDEISQAAGISKYHLSRMFRKSLGVTPFEYLRAARHQKLKEGLFANGGRVIDAIYDAGYGSTSRAHEQSSEKLGMTHSAYRSHGRGLTIRYGIFQAEYGRVLIGATDKGVCAIRIGDSDEEMFRDIKSEFSAANLVEDHESLRALFEQIESYVFGKCSQVEFDLDVDATAFQARVWKALRETRRGERLSYSELAGRIGSPKAIRAVARACAANPVALVVPCHRIVGADGSLTGYRWGVERKRQLLEIEKKS